MAWPPYQQRTEVSPAMLLRWVTPEITARFWAKVSRPTAREACWPWMSTRDKDGYGVFTASLGGKERKGFRAHRFAYLATYGAFLPGFHVCHSCDIHWCVNPQHLFLGTNADNMRDMYDKDRHPAKTDGLRWSRHFMNRRFTDAQIEEVRRAYASGEGSTRVLGKRFGMSGRYVHQIVTYQIRTQPSDDLHETGAACPQ